MAATKSVTTQSKSHQVSTTISTEYFEALEDHRWTVRKKMTEVVRDALDDYCSKHGIKVTDSPKA